jgi:hypothetical protein
VPRPRFQPHGVRLVAQPAQKIGPLDPREDPGSDLVVHEAGRYRTWYWRGECAYYAESGDGFAWRPPAPGRVEPTDAEGGDGDGSVGSAVFRAPPGQSHFDGFCAFADPHAPRDERYKLLYMARSPERDAARLTAERARDGAAASGSTRRPSPVGA